MKKPRQLDKQRGVTIPLKRAALMVASYARAKLYAQLKAVSFVVLYLLSAQLLIFRVPIADALGVALGVGATVAGLAFFLEGLFLGIMPLGEHCGLRLPGKAGPLLIGLFSLVLGITATLAEPAIGFLKAQGGALRPWDSPLLYFMLNRGSTLLVWAVAGGVGVAVTLGVFRFLYEWSFKPFVFVLAPAMLALSFFFEADASLAPLAGLAWDTGGVTTGPVTVPLVIALGIGVSRIAGAKRTGASGLGVVTLASALPVLAVFALGLVLSPLCPAPGASADYFSAEEGPRERALFVAGGEAELKAQASSALGRGQLSAEAFIAAFPDSGDEGDAATPASSGAGSSWALGHALGALKAVLPLALVLIIVLMVLLRERLRGADEIALGLAFAVLGMFLFNMGMERGLSSLGRQSGASLPRAYETTLRDDKAVTLRGVNEAAVFSAQGEDGPREYLWLQRPGGPVAVPFDRSSYDEASSAYRHVPVEGALFSAWGRYAGLAAVLLFVFILGVGATLAEPSLAALGATVEELTTGTYRKATLIRNVAMGVGIGMAAGFARILFGLSLSWILAPAYALALMLTLASSEEFSAIAWDSAGVTTGPVTVPLVIAAGLGIGGGGAASFGVVAAASVFPVLAVLASGIVTQARSRRSIRLELP